MGSNDRVLTDPSPVPLVQWPTTDYSRVPYWLFHDPGIYAAERDRIFKGPAWFYLLLEAEIPNVGDFRTTFVGDIPVIVNRGKDGKVHAMLNRCAHRGAVVRRETHGNAADHVCIYHRWCYDLDGSLIGVPFRRGIKGKGGMSPDFDPAKHGLSTLVVESFAGVVFGTFCKDAEPLNTFLGPMITKHLERLFHRPVRVLGYQRQRILGNWKLYAENPRDMYHASLLHEFMSTFSINRFTHTGGLEMDGRHRHTVTWSKTGTDDESEFKELFKTNRVHESKLQLSDPSVLKFHPEFEDGVSLAICTIFPTCTIHQISNSLAMRQVRPMGPGEFELSWTAFGYADDTEEMTLHRLVQANMVGPAGLISLEDAEAIEIVQLGSARDDAACSVIEMGGGGEITNRDHHVTDVACRGFWSYYAELMGIEPEGAVR